MVAISGVGDGVAVLEALGMNCLMAIWIATKMAMLLPTDHTLASHDDCAAASPAGGAAAAGILVVGGWDARWPLIADYKCPGSYQHRLAIYTPLEMLQSNRLS